jgi:hypothetical protein
MCDCNFDSSYAYIIKNIIDKPITKINIIDYLKNEKIQKKVKKCKLYLVCLNGNELVKVKYESKIGKSHFRHNNDSKCMCEWHKNWQNEFDIIEYHIGNRIADAIVNDIVIEFQHSYISIDEVKERGIDYLSYNKKLYWVIDCNDSISITQRGDIYLIKFIKDIWKYEHFTSNDYIFLNIDNRLFKINPSLVKSNMIDVREYKLNNEFIDSLNNNIDIWDNSDIIQCTLYHNQRGAGCGKTYESIQLLNKNKIFKDKNIFLYLTKMHSAKEVIYNELIEQYKRGELDNIEIDKDGENKSGKQYKLSYLNKITNTICTIIIGTIDSFMYAIGDKKNRYNDYFAGIVKSIKDGYVETKKDGSIKYSLDTIKLNKNCLLIIDEAQDLGPQYIEAVCCIMRNTYIDGYVIGDKLQSIWGEHNIHTFLEHNDLPNINIVRDNGINRVMRFHNIQFQDFVNNIIDFKKYNLPQIEQICNNIKDCKYKHENEIKPYTIIPMEKIYPNEIEVEKVDKIVKKITDYMDSEINNYNYLPNNFMFIFPILSKNYLANRLESKLQEFWINKFNDKKYQDNVLAKNIYWKDKINDNYYKYVYLHKSDEARSINLKESENGTRILSIHASKGNGSEVVFLFGLSEYTLRVFSKDKCNLVYDSLLHVALTRQKKSLYIGMENNGDDISNRFNKFNIESDNDIKPRIEDIKIHNKYNDVIDYSIKTIDIFANIDKQYIKPYNLELFIPQTNDDKNIIEWGHHIIRYYVFLYYIKYNIYSDFDKNNIIKKQFCTVLNKISKLSITRYLHNDYYKYIIINLRNKIDNNDDLDCSTDDNQTNANEIPILIFKTNGNTKYNNYESIITKIIEHIQKKIKDSLKNNKLPLFCPLEIIILYYIIKIRQNGVYSDITIMDIYSMLYIYDECSNSINEQHNKYKCICKDQFSENNNSTGIYKEMRESIKNHYEKTKQVEQIYLNYKEYLIKNLDNPLNFTYNIFHPVVYGNIHDNFKIINEYPLIANSDKYIINFIIIPQFNKLNFNDIMFDGIMNKYLLLNSCKKQKNFTRFDNKEIITCIFTLDSTQPIFINFNVNKNDNIIKENIKSFLINKYQNKHKIIYQYYQHCKNHKPKDKKKMSSIKYTHGEIKDINSCRPHIPEYIEKYFYDIDNKIEECIKLNQSQKYIEDTVLFKVNDLDLFLDDINNYLIKSVNEYLNIEEITNDNDDYNL